MKLKLTNKTILKMKEEAEYIKCMAHYATATDNDVNKDYESYCKMTHYAAVANNYTIYQYFEIPITCITSEMLYRGLL